MSFDNKCGTYIPGLDPNGNDMTEEAMVDPAFSPEQWVGEPIAKLMGKVFMMYLSATRGRTPLSFGIEFLRATLFMRFGYDVRKKPESEGSLDCWLCVRLGLPKPNPAPTPDKDKVTMDAAVKALHEFEKDVLACPPMHFWYLFHLDVIEQYTKNPENIKHSGPSMVSAVSDHKTHPVKSEPSSPSSDGGVELPPSPEPSLPAGGNAAQLGTGRGKEPV